MNYFELFGIPVALRLDKQSLTKKFFELSRASHPDFFTGHDHSVQTAMLEKSATLNKAYKTFQQPDDLLKYVLQLKGLLQEEEKYQLAPNFLMEVMEVNESLMDMTSDTPPDQLKEVENQVQSLEQAIYEPVAQIIENYQDGITTEKELLQVKEYYFRKKYLQRILDKIRSIRNIAPHS